MQFSAIILAAGAGTRMKSKKPKVIHEILGKPLIRYAIDCVKNAGAKKVFCVVGFGKEQIEPLCFDCETCVQKNLLGTGDAVNSARDLMKNFEGSVIVTYADCPLLMPKTLEKLARIRMSEGASLSLVTMQTENPYGYGRIVRNEQGCVEKIVEEKDCDESQRKIKECNTGLYCFDSKMLFDALNNVKNVNSQGEYYLTDVIEIIARAGHKIVSIEAEDENEFIGVNSKVQLEAASKIMQRRINDFHMEMGVTIWDSATTYIGPDVKIEADVEIMPNTILLGNTEIKTCSVIGPNTRLKNSKVGVGCRVDETIGDECVIEDGATTGPRCYLRPKAHICKGAKAGTCVEIKNSVVGEKSKVPHLSYVGDATIDAGVNLGAGTITCNYDGENKHKTTIGKDTFIGSSTMLVAPVSVGDNVVVGAGSVITDDVPSDTLAFGRARQVNKVGRLKKEE